MGGKRWVVIMALPIIGAQYIPSSSPSPFSHLSSQHLAQQYSTVGSPTTRLNEPPAVTMVARNSAAVNLRLPPISLSNLARLNDRVNVVVLNRRCNHALPNITRI